jgi:hypothetical protein
MDATKTTVRLEGSTTATTSAHVSDGVKVKIQDSGRWAILEITTEKRS